MPSSRWHTTKYSLSMLTTSALSRIHTNNNLKFHKIPFGNGLRKQSLDKVTFPVENSLTEMIFLQAYRNWLMLIDIVLTPDIAIGWHEHHSRILRDNKFTTFFHTWHDMEKNYILNSLPTPLILTLTASPTFNFWREHA